MFPGLPDALPDMPPKAREYAALTLDEAIARSHALLDEVLATNTAEHVLGLFSGGGDSSILAHLMRERVHAFAHIDTGIAVPATLRYVEAVSAEWQVPLRVVRADDSYDDLVLGQVKAKTKDRAVWVGFPGPPGHYVMYVRLKERALDKLRRDLIGPRGKSGQVVFLAGMRWGESDRRFRNAAETDRWGAVTWCSPIVYWTDGHVAEYRARYMCHQNHEHAPHRLCRPGALPLSEVTEHLHMSGDCLCGAYAKPGELAQIELFYPEVAQRIRALERRAEAAGVERCRWGAGKQRGEPAAPAPGRLCSSCVPEQEGPDLFDLWREAGLLSDAQHAELAASATRPYPTGDEGGGSR
jgi:3'-phosphoadenosine 5'-phosphosulfate sulfotransferase (PAPS reductase)/FAD synthetase